MTINIRWQNEKKTVLLQSYEDLWTLAEYQHATETVYGMLEEVSHPVDLIIDLTLSTTLTADLLTYAERGAQLKSEHVHNNQRRVIIVGASLLLKTIMKFNNTMMWLAEGVDYADTVDEAMVIFADYKTQSVFRFNHGHTRPLQSINAS